MLASETIVIVDEGPGVRLAVEAAVFEALDALGCPEWSLAVHLTGFVVPVDILVGCQQLGGDGVGVERSRTVIDYLRFATVAALGRDEDDAVGAAHTVDCGGGRVFEDGNRLDVVGIDVGHRTLHTVHQYQRRRIVEGAGSTDEQGRRVSTGYTRRLHCCDTGKAAGKHSAYVSVRGFQQVFAADLRNRAHYEFLFLSSITDYEDFLKDIGVFFKDHVDLCAIPYSDFLVFVAHKAVDKNLVRAGNRDKITAVRIGHGPAAGISFHEHYHSRLGSG